MCGIVGAVGHGEAESFILEGLRRLEYRGYDSAGIGVIDSHGSLHRLRAAGKVQALCGQGSGRASRHDSYRPYALGDARRRQ